MNLSSHWKFSRSDLAAQIDSFSFFNWFSFWPIRGFCGKPIDQWEVRWKPSLVLRPRIFMDDPMFFFILFNASSAILSSKITALFALSATESRILTLETLYTHQFFYCFPLLDSNKMVKVVASIQTLFIGLHVVLVLRNWCYVILYIGVIRSSKYSLVYS